MTTMTEVPVNTTQVYQLYIQADRQQVWEAITDPEIVAKFFHGARVESTYEVGTPIRSWSPDHTQMWGDNTILECDPPSRLVHTWRSLYDPASAAEPASRVTWEIEPVGPGLSKLTLVHDQMEDSPNTAASVRGWTYILSNLKTVIETGNPLPSIIS